MTQMLAAKDTATTHRTGGRLASPDRTRADHSLQGLREVLGNRAMQRTIAPITGRVPAGTIQRTCACGGTDSDCQCNKDERGLPFIHREASDGGSGIPSRSTVAKALSGQTAGRPLDPSARAFMEPRFGRDFRGVRIHSDASAARAARMISAEAFTTGRDIYFAAGRYDPNTSKGRRLLAHELTHTIQQGGGQSGGNGEVSSRNDPFEFEATRVADRALASSSADPETSVGLSTTSPMIRRSPDDDSSWWQDVKDVGSAAVQGVKDVGSAGVQAVKDVASDVVAGVKSTASDVEQDVAAAGKAVVQDVKDAGGWLTTAAGEAALAGANELASLFGGTVTVTASGIEITFPSVSLFKGSEIAEIPLPTIGGYFPIVGVPFFVGPVLAVATLGVRLSGEPSIVIALGPGLLRGVRIVIDPVHSHYSGRGQIYLGAALGLRAILRAGVGAGLTVVLPTVPPIPISLVLDGGLRWTVTGSLVGAIQSGVLVDYSGGSLSIDVLNDLLGGVLLEVDLNAYVSARLQDKIICEYIWPGAHWQTGKAWQLTIPVAAGGAVGGIVPTVGAVRIAPFPVEDILTGLQRPAPGLNCLGYKDLLGEYPNKGPVTGIKVCARPLEGPIYSPLPAAPACVCP